MPRVKGTETEPGHFAPVIYIDLRINGVGGPVPAIVDSGADKCLVPGEYVELANIPFSSLQPLPEGVSASGTFPKSLGQGEISYGGRVICTEFEVAPPAHLGIVLLGREEFFTKFRVNFLWNRNPPVFDLDPIS